MAALRAALDVSGVEAHTIGAVEAHGTGTPVGDPIEFTSLATEYGTTGTVLLGSAKSNFGHAEAAAGAMGFVKAVLEVQHGVVPPMVHFHRLPEALASVETGLSVPQVVTPWPAGHGEVRRIAVSSYGISGTNVHAIVEQAPTGESTSAQAGGPTTGARLFVLSSTSAEELRRTADRIADWLEHQRLPVPLHDLGYTLSRRRGHRTVRAGVVAGDLKELCAGLQDIAAGDTPSGEGRAGRPRTGMGVLGPGLAMGADGRRTAGHRSGVRIDHRAPGTVDRPGVRLLGDRGDVRPETVTGIDKVQPTLFAMQVGLAEAMAANGVRPGAVIGHSMGEAAAAVVAGSLSLQDGVRVICRRSRLLARLAGSGAMASVELPEQTVRSELAARGVDDVVVAVVASPQTTVIGGDTATIRELVAQWEERDVLAREVAVDVASHSPQVDPILATLADELAELAPGQGGVRYYSATLPDPRAVPTFDAGYWVDNLRQMVRFSAAVRAALEDGYRVFAELSPHPCSPGRSSRPQPAPRRPSRRWPGCAAISRCPTGCWNWCRICMLLGAAVDFAALYPAGRLVEVPLPSWTHHHLLLPRDKPAGRPSGAGAPLLGAHVRLLEEPERHAWQSDVGTAVVPWGPTTRCTTWRLFPARPTARWRWPPPRSCSPRVALCVTSASRICCSSTTTPS